MAFALVTVIPVESCYSNLKFHTAFFSHKNLRKTLVNMNINLYICLITVAFCHAIIATIILINQPINHLYYGKSIRRNSGTNQ